MTEISQSEAQASQRNWPSRLGIVLLNLITPGLGLFRISQFRLGFMFWILAFSSIVILLISFSIIKSMTFSIYAGIGIFVLVWIGLVYFGSMITTWRLNAIRSSNNPWWSKWYGLFVIYLVGLCPLFLTDEFSSHYKSFYAPSESMVPTIEPQDKFLSKMRDFSPLRRGDIFIVKNGNTVYVKRLAALPGDTFSMVNGTVIINGVRVIQRKVGTRKTSDSFSASDTLDVLSEQFPGELKAHSITDSGYTQADDRPETKLGPNEYFFLGDNRDNAADSRFHSNQMGLGMVSKERIMGKVLFRYWRKGSGYGEGQY